MRHALQIILVLLETRILKINGNLKMLQKTNEHENLEKHRPEEMKLLEDLQGCPVTVGMHIFKKTKRRTYKNYRQLELRFHWGDYQLSGNYPVFHWPPLSIVQTCIVSPNFWQKQYMFTTYFNFNLDYQGLDYNLDYQVLDYNLDYQGSSTTIIQQLED